jgi:hypothetical protein
VHGDYGASHIVGQLDCRGCVTVEVDRADLTLQRLIEHATEPLGCYLATSTDLPYRAKVGRKWYRQDFPCPAFDDKRKSSPGSPDIIT